MVKEKVASGQAEPAERPGRKLLLSPTEQSTRDAQREFKRNLLRKRETWDAHFRANLTSINNALLRVQIKRDARDRLAAPLGSSLPTRVCGWVRADHVQRLKQSGEKEIPKTRKYLTRRLSILEKELGAKRRSGQPKGRTGRRLKAARNLPPPNLSLEPLLDETSQKRMANQEAVRQWLSNGGGGADIYDPSLKYAMACGLVVPYPELLSVLQSDLKRRGFRL